jgi:hypothetical protein
MCALRRAVSAAAVKSAGKSLTEFNEFALSSTNRKQGSITPARSSAPTPADGDAANDEENQHGAAETARTPRKALQSSPSAGTLKRREVSRSKHNEVVGMLCESNMFEMMHADAL